MNHDHLRTFLAVSEAGSFVAASAATGASRTTLMRRVAALERDLGQQLLIRSEAGVESSAAGLLLARRGRELVARLDGCLMAARRVEAPRRPLVLVVPPGLQNVAIRRLVPRLLSVEDEPIRVRVAPDPASCLEPGVLALVRGPAVRAGWWDAAEAGRLEHRLLASRDYLAARGMPGHVAELASHRLITESGAPAWPLVGGGSMSVAPSIEVATQEALRLAIAEGLGIGLVDWEAEAAIGQELVPVLAEVVGGGGPLSLLGDPVWVERLRPLLATSTDPGR